MKPGQASRTAEYAAGFRAMESARPPARDRLFEDPFAARFLSAQFLRYVRWSSVPVLGGIVRAYLDRVSGGAMSSGIARTRLIDDHLRQALRDGLRRVVLLGAGFDCRPYRLPEMSGLEVVEIDHPDSQAVKKRVLTGVLGTLPESVRYLGADLTRRALPDVWREAGLTEGVRSFIIWEGVTHYLGETAVSAVLNTLSQAAAPGSLLVFTYLHGGLLDGSVQFDLSEGPRARVAGVGEPWVWGLDPARMPQYLAERGFELLSDLSADEYRTRYWGERGRRMRGFSFYRCAMARVKGDADIALSRPGQGA